MEKSANDWTDQEHGGDSGGRSPDASLSRSSPWLALRSDVPSALLAIMLLLLPLYRTRVLEDSFNTPKLALAMVLGVLTAIGLMARSQTFRMKLRWYPTPWLMVGLAVWLALSVLWSESKPLGVDGTVYFATFAVIGWLFYRGPRSMAALRGLFHAGAIGAVVTAVWVLIDDFTGGAGALVARLPDWRGHLAAGLGNSGHIAGMVGMFLPWVLLNFLWRGGKFGTPFFPGKSRHWFLLPIIVLMFAALTVTWSVGSAGSTILSLAIWGIVAWFAIPRRGVSREDSSGLSWRRLWVIIAAGLMVMTFYFLPHAANPHKPTLWKQAFGSDRWEAGWPTRVVIWETTWQIIRESPMVGIGVGNFTYGYTQQVVPSVLTDPKLAPYSGAFTNDAHNDYLQLWAEGGVVALGLWMAVLSTFTVTIVRMFRSSKVDTEMKLLLCGAGAGMTVFALDGLMSFPMRLPAHFTMAMFFLSVPGVLLRLQAREFSGRDGSPSRPQSSPSRPHGSPSRPQSSPSRPPSHDNRARIYRRRLRAGGIGILLTLAACVWHHGHRVVAEYYLKAGRGVASAAVVSDGEGRILPVWEACNAIYQQTLRAVAAGAPKHTWEKGVARMIQISRGAAMDKAGDYFQKALDADRWYANASSRLGQLFLFRGQFKECLHISRRTLKTLEAYEIHERMGAAAFFMGDYKTAREHWSVCLTRRPGMESFYRGLLQASKSDP